MRTATAPLSARLEHLASEFADHAWKFREHPGSAFVQDHAYSLNEFARQAADQELVDGSSMTAAQQVRIARLLGSGHVRQLTFGYHPFDLAEGWITVSIEYENGTHIFAGISPEGDMHT